MSTFDKTRGEISAPTYHNSGIKSPVCPIGVSTREGGALSSLWTLKMSIVG